VAELDGRREVVVLRAEGEVLRVVLVLRVLEEERMEEEVVREVDRLELVVFATAAAAARSAVFVVESDVVEVFFVDVDVFFAVAVVVAELFFVAVDARAVDEDETTLMHVDSRMA
jgi:hypothetical protein